MSARSYMNKKINSNSKFYTNYDDFVGDNVRENYGFPKDMNNENFGKGLKFDKINEMTYYTFQSDLFNYTKVSEGYYSSNAYRCFLKFILPTQAVLDETFEKDLTDLPTKPTNEDIPKYKKFFENYGGKFNS
jgi:hypothetical protein